MKTIILRLFLIGCLTTALTTQLGALTLSTPGVVGTVNGQASDNQSDEQGFAQHLLDMLKNSTEIFPAVTGHSYTTGPTEYAGTISGNLTGTDLSGTVVPAGYAWAIAKYDGQNAGYVLFNLADFGSLTLPEYSYSIWGSNAEQYRISHFTPFNTTGDIPPVPEGGSSVVLLGLALCALQILRRRASV